MKQTLNDYIHKNDFIGAIDHVEKNQLDKDEFDTNGFLSFEVLGSLFYKFEAIELIKTLIKHNLLPSTMLFRPLVNYLIELKSYHFAAEIIKSHKFEVMQTKKGVSPLTGSLVQGADELVNILLTEYGPEVFWKPFADEHKNIKEQLQEFISSLAFDSLESFSLDDFNMIHGLIIIAELASKNEIENITFLQDHEDVSEEFAAWLGMMRQKIAEGLYPINEKFVLYGRHWKTGEFNVDNSGNINIFLNDSVPSYARGNIATLKALFKDYAVNIYCSSQKIQNDYESCPIFALDNLKRQLKINHYLPLESNGSIYQYFTYSIAKNNLSPDETFGRCRVYHCELPLYLMQTMQSSDLFTMIYPNRTVAEQDLPINKKGHTSNNSWRSHFIVNPYPEGKMLNIKLNQKLESMRLKVLDFVGNKSIDELLVLIKKFTLEGFASRFKLSNKNVSESDSMISQKRVKTRF